MSNGRLRSVLIAATVLVAAPAALAAGAHSHGIAELSVAVDGPSLTLQLDIPLDSLVGFERAPRNDAERELVRTAAQALRSGRSFAPTAAARCRLDTVQLASPVLAPELLGGSGTAAGPAPKDEHAELSGTFVYRCDEPKALAGIDVMLFDQFKRLRRVDAQVAGPKGQAAAKLTAKSRQLRW